ncbi:hypothetical protein FGE21_13875 [Phaeobacter sp. B1627]|nr:hypothetical protein FGE21_13875 [Phaeobacter sp. B1627]
MDIPYIPMARGFVYLVAVLAWRLSVTLETIRSLKRYIAREVFGTIMRRQKQINQSQITACLLEGRPGQPLHIY